MRELSAKVDAVTRLIHGHDSASLLNTYLANRTLVELLRMFLSLSTKGSPGLAKKFDGLYPDITRDVMQLKSCSASCTLKEFLALTAALTADESISVTTLPPVFDIYFADVDQVSAMGIGFDSYSDLCNALHISAPKRIDGIYRVKTMRVPNKSADGAKRRKTTIRSIQLIASAELNTADSTFRIYLGGTRATARRGSCTVLQHVAPEWCSTDWDRGLTLSDLADDTADPTSTNPARRHSSVFRQTFSAVWTRSKQATGEFGFTARPETVSGFLALEIPVVTIRGDRLVGSTTRLLSRDGRPNEVIKRLCT